LTLFSQRPTAANRPLVAWSGGIISGVAAHAAYAAMGDGMAPFSLRELIDPDVPSKNKRALLEGLPKGIVNSGGLTVQSQLLDALRATTDAQVWAAIASTLARDGFADWIDCLEEAVTADQAWLDERFWRRIGLNVHQLVQQGWDAKQQATVRLQQLRARLQNRSAASEVSDILRTVEAMRTPRHVTA